MAKASSWLRIFESFIKDIRIKSRESTSRDPRGAPLVLWESQRRFLRQLGEGLDDGIHVHYWLKSRQLGITTVSVAVDVFWLAMHPNILGALVTENEKNRDKNRAMIRSYIESFPDGYFGSEFRIVKGKDNVKFMQFSNGSRIDFLVAGTKKKSIAWGEGEGYTFAHLTEIASYSGSEGLSSFEESFSQSNPDRLYIYESTAKGTGNVWEARWRSGFTDPITRRSHFIGWWASDVNVVPRSSPLFAQYGRIGPNSTEREQIARVKRLYEYEVSQEQLAWYRWRSATTSGDDALLDQNQPWTAEEAFVVTGYSFFQNRQLTRDMKRILDNEGNDYGYIPYAYDLSDSFFTMKLRALEIASEDDEAQIELRVWEEPSPNGRYVIGFDPAYGRTDHKDKHCISVWRCYADCVVQVAEYATHDVEVTRASWVLFHLAGAYRDCMLNVELGGPGRMVLQEFDNLKGQLQSPIYGDQARSRDWEDAFGWARWYLFHRADSIGKGYLNCFETTWRTKQELMHQFRDNYVTKQIHIRSLNLVREMTHVRVDGSEIGAPESSSEDIKDDRVFAAALAVRAWINWRRAEMLAEGLTRERVSDEEAGRTNLVTQRVNNVVYRFLMTQEELSREAELRPLLTWREERGLE